MAALAGRDLRIKISLDGGTTFTAVVGSTSDNFNITKEGINITDKDDDGVQTFISNAVGVWSMEGGFEGVVKNGDLLAFMADVDQFTYDAEISISGIGTFAGDFGITAYGFNGVEGAEATTFNGTIVSSGTITYTAA